jgi:heptosyltransferase III
MCWAIGRAFAKRRIVRILIHRLGSLGDVVVTLPSFRVVRQAYPSAHITVLTNPPVSEKAAPLESIVAGMGLFDDTLHYPMASRDYRQLAKLHREIRRRRFDLYISLTHGRHIRSSLRDFVYFRTCGIPRIIGLPFALRDRVPAIAGDGPLYESEAARMLRRVRPAAPTLADTVDLSDPRWTDLQLTPAELEEGARALAAAGITVDFIVASVGTKWSQNEWGADRWSELISRLGQLYPQRALVLVGSADEAERCDRLLQCWPGPRANLCGKFGPRSSSAVMSRARVFLGHDSGPMHLAAASGIRCVAIFSTLNPPGRWFPLGHGHMPLYPECGYDPKRKFDIPHQQEAIRSITVDTVLQALRSILDEPKP